MKRVITTLCLGLIIIPLILLVIFSYAVVLPSNKPMPLRPPKPVPLEGYEIIYTYTINRSPDTSRFYYLSTKRQVIYRYDADRYLELQGENCNGLIWYHDDKNNIHTRITRQFFNANDLPQFNYYNPGENYIAIPKNNLSRFVFSLDGGRTFMDTSIQPYAAVPGDEVDHFIGLGDPPIEAEYPNEDEKLKEVIRTISVSGDTGYFVLKNGDVLFGESHLYWTLVPLDTSQIIVRYGGIEPSYLSLNIIQDSTKRDFLRLTQYHDIYKNKDYISRIASVKNIIPQLYQGWDKIRCEVGAER